MYVLPNYFFKKPVFYFYSNQSIPCKFSTALQVALASPPPHSRIVFVFMSSP